MRHSGWGNERQIGYKGSVESKTERLQRGGPSRAGAGGVARRRRKRCGDGACVRTRNKGGLASAKKIRLAVHCRDGSSRFLYPAAPGAYVCVHKGVAPVCKHYIVRLHKGVAHVCKHVCMPDV